MKSKFKFSITGPESTGKSTLAKELSDFFKFPLIIEYAREYLIQGGLVSTTNDLVSIAHEQIRLENYSLSNTNQAIICDTDMLVLNVWSQEIFKLTPVTLKALFRHHRYDLTLLCEPDIQWEPDPLRVNPFDRKRLFDIYQELLVKHKMEYKIIAGSGSARTEQAINIIETYLKHH